MELHMHRVKGTATCDDIACGLDLAEIPVPIRLSPTRFLVPYLNTITTAIV